MWNDFFRIVATVAPAVASALPGGALLAPLIAHAVTTAENLKHGDGSPLSGAEKKTAAMSIVGDSVAAVNAAAKTKNPDRTSDVLDAATLGDAVSKAIDATVDVANLVHAGVQATGHYTQPQSTTDHTNSPTVQPPTVKPSANPLGNL